MSNKTSMNISPQNVQGICTYKCDFSFDYPTSSCIATNNGTYLTLSYTDSSAPVKFNNKSYNVSTCYLYSPSLHLYNDQNADAELMIVHQPTTGGKTLYICIPITINGTSNNASKKISELINAVSKGAPYQGGSTNQGITDFTLNEFIPLKEFFSYSTNNSDMLAFGLQNAIYISQSNLELLKKLIKPYGGTAFQSGPGLYINEKGPTKGTPATSNDIYIDCQPTNSSEDETNEVVNIKSETVFDLNNVMSNPFFLSILFGILFLIIIMGTYKGINYLTGGGITPGNVGGNLVSITS
jgi:carbonic anhydrase